MSKYNSIETATELVKEVKAHGLSTIQEDICRAQDIFGRATIEELDRLANDIGRNNDDGGSDQKGSWSSNRQPIQSTFYTIAFSIWNWEDATRFWNQHTNPERVELVEARRQLKKLSEEADEKGKALLKEHQAVLDERKKVIGLEAETRKLGAELHDSKMNEMELKARLYDLLIAEKEEQK